MKNYLTYPCEVMSVTQGYTGNYSHGPHNTGSPKDYPWDEACGTTARSPMYCPCDEMIIKRIYTTGSNTIWLESTSKVLLADGTEEFVTLMVTHPNDSDIKRLKEGQKFKRDELICYEGTDGNATGNHFHFAVGKGKIKGNGWVQNSKGKWVLTTEKGSQKPETMFFIDKKFTTVKKTGGINLKEVPKEESFFPPHGYFRKGDKGENVEKINEFYYNTFPAYAKTLNRVAKNVRGTLFGDNSVAWTKEFQKRTGLEQDGNVGPLTLAKLKEFGFKE